MPKKIGENLRKILKMKKTNDSYQYTLYKKPQQNTNEWRREQERQRRVKIITIVMITLECIIGISVISYFSIYGT